MQLRASFHNTLGGCLRMAFQVLTIPLLVRLIGLEEFGVWALVSTVLGITFVVEGGLTVSTTVYVARDLSRQDANGLAQTLTVTLGSMALLATLAAAGLWGGSGMISRLFANLQPGQREVVVESLRISALAIWANLVLQVFVGVEQACNRYGLMNVVATVQQALLNCGMLAIAILGGRVVAFVKWQVVVAGLTLGTHAVIAWWLVRPWHLRPQWNPERGRELGRYSLMTWLGMLGTVLVSQCDRLIIGVLLPTRALGAYTAITNITVRINNLSALPVQPLLPLLSQGREAAGEWATQVRQAVRMNGLIAFALGAALCLFAPLVVQLIFEENNPELVRLFRLSGLIYTLYSLNATGYFILLGLGQARRCMEVIFLSGFVGLALIAAGASARGLRGAFCGTAGYLLTLLLTWQGLRQLKYSARLWMEWLRGPLLWFALVLPLNWLLPDVLVWKVAWLVAQMAVLGLWWLRTERVPWLKSET
jgi:O-antigen/teichoic acid export membrane protein